VVGKRFCSNLSRQQARQRVGLGVAPSRQAVIDHSG